MNERLYFLLPDREHTLRVVNELAEKGFDPRQMHTLAGRGLSTEGLPASNTRQRENFAGRVEFWTWRANLALFFFAAVALVIMAFQQAGLWILLPLAVMLATLVPGNRFARVPNVHLQEFRDALRHGEILLMIDVPQQRVDEVEYRVHARHPEAVAGGSSWNAPLLHT
ncbi:MAG: DUF805 domain-containing protein [Thiogranum sp.]|jgi:hypothetical protein|nr:DUF805 domain-containing protein [Thiogranum sp.]